MSPSRIDPELLASAGLDRFVGPDDAVERVRLAAYGWCEDGGRVLLCRISDPGPAGGQWTLPGGGLDFGEDPVDGLRRELREETGLEGAVGELLGVRSAVLEPGETTSGHRVQTVGLLYRVTVTGGEPRDETDGSTDLAAWVPWAEVPALPHVGLVAWATEVLGVRLGSWGPVSPARKRQVSRLGYAARMPDLPTWERRFRSPILSFPSWAPGAPERMVIASTESGSYQLHAWDRATGARRQVTHDPVGVLAGRPTPDGSGVVWFHDATGAESGGWVVAPFDEPSGQEPLLEGVPEGWAEGLVMGRHRTVAAISTPDGYSAWVSDDGAPARLLHEHPQPFWLAGGMGMAGSVDRGALSPDEAVLVIEVMEDGDVLHPGLRAVDVATGAPLAELRDEGLSLSGFGFEPGGEGRWIAITHERTGAHRPALWNVATGEVRDLPVDLRGDIEPSGWWPDGSAVLLLELHDGRHRLHRHDIATGTTTLLDTEPGSITAAAVRPDGQVWYRVHNGVHPARIVAVGTVEPLVGPEGPGAPDGQPFEAWSFDNPHGQRVHGFLVQPAGDGPHPVMMRVHGGPHSLDMDRWAPDIAAHVDAGFLVAMVNYRGSIGFGQAWRDELTGNVGFLELEDVLAGLDDLLARGLGDPTRVVLAGWSWGGYVTLLGIGRHPDRWISAIGGVPVADYVAAFEDEAPSLQAIDRALFGGDPTTRPDFYAERSPISYADNVRVPLLILAGDNDSRCPIRQVWNYVGRLRGRGVEPEVYTYSTGHASFDMDERVKQTAIVLDFLARTVPGARRLDGIDGLLPAG